MEEALLGIVDNDSDGDNDGDEPPFAGPGLDVEPDDNVDAQVQENRSIRALLENDDPELDCLNVGSPGSQLYYPPDGDWEMDGVNIGKSTNLEGLTMHENNMPNTTDEDVTKFFNGFSNNRSMFYLTVVGGDLFIGRLFTLLAPFLENNQNFHVLEVDWDSVGDFQDSSSIVSSLSKFSSLQELELKYMSLSEEDFEKLIPTLSRHHGLKKLSLCSNTLGLNGCEQVATWLQKPSCVLETLELDVNQIGDRELAVLVNGLNKNHTVKELSLDFNDDITIDGWQMLCGVWESPKSKLETLSIADCNIGDDVLAIFANNLVVIRKLKNLNISQNTDITLRGWQALATLLQSPDCILEDLELSECSICDDGAIAIATSLMVNSTLNELCIGNYIEDNPPKTTNIGLSAFSRCLCNTSSIMDTFSSNHSLQKLIVSSSTPMPSDLSCYLKLNRENSPTVAARKKVISTHFSAGIQTQPLIEMEIKVLPHAICWMGKLFNNTVKRHDVEFSGRVPDVGGITVIYQFIKNVPSFFGLKDSSSNEIRPISKRQKLT